METGNSTLLITPENVHECLSKLVEISPQKSPNPLHFLLLVDLYVTINTHLPLTPQRRYDALNHILASFVADQYKYHRATLNLTALNEKDLNQQQALSYIAEEGLLASVELLSWSWLYYHFVRVEFDIAYTTFCNHAHIDKRTLRRYQQHGIKRLTDYLSEKEGEARKEQRKRWMYTQLPASVFTVFLAREDLLTQTTHLLQKALPAHIQISGASGIGKTTFAGVIAKNQIDAGSIDRFIWINRPKSVEFVRQYLCEHLLPEQSAISLREYALLQRLLIIVDDIEDIQEDGNSLAELLDELSPAQVLLISRVYAGLLRAIHIPINELSREGIYAILNSQAVNDNEPLIEERAAHIWEYAGGNPGAAILMLHHWPFNTILSSVDADNNPLLHTYSALTPNLKKAWLSFALLPPIIYDLKSIIQFWSTEISELQLQFLFRQHMVELIEDESGIRCGLSTLGRRLIENRYASDSELQQLLNKLLNYLESRASADSHLMIQVVEHLLLSSWLQLDNHTREVWIQRFYEQGLEQGHAAQWATILEPYSKCDQLHLLRLSVSYGVCLRRVSQWEKAEAIFEQVTASAGRGGQFLDQSYALLEWAILLERQGNYKKVLEHLAHVELTLSKHEDEHLLYALRVEQTQIALDTADIDRVEELIHSLPETPQTVMLWCELLLLKHDYRSLLRIFQKTKFDRPRDFAHMEVIVGQSYQQMLDFPKAYQHLYAALTVLEENGDIFAASRIRSNLGAIMIEQGAYRDARLTLEYAENMQKQLRDQVGLAVTRHNIQLLKRKVVG